MTLAQVDVSSISMDTYISLGVLVVIISSAWKLSGQLTEIRMKLETHKHVPGRVKHIETHLLIMEEDINNLWANQRADPESRIFDRTRASRFKPYEEGE